MKTKLLMGMVVAVAFGGVLQAVGLFVATRANQVDRAYMVVVRNDSPKALLSGNLLLAEGRYADAVAYFMGIGAQVKAKGKTTREPYRLQALATALLRCGRYSEAENTATKALEHRMDLGGAWYVLGMAQEYQFQHQEAISTFAMGIAAMQAAGKDASALEASRMYLRAQGEEKVKGNTQVSAATGF